MTLYNQSEKTGDRRCSSGGSVPNDLVNYQYVFRQPPAAKGLPFLREFFFIWNSVVYSVLGSDFFKPFNSK